MLRVVDVVHRHQGDGELALDRRVARFVRRDEAERGAVERDRMLLAQPRPAWPAATRRSTARCPRPPPASVRAPRSIGRRRRSSPRGMPRPRHAARVVPPGRIWYATSRMSPCLIANCWSPWILDTASRRTRSRCSSEPSSAARSRAPSMRASAPFQKTRPTTAASISVARSSAGSASRRAAMIARMLVGSSSASPVVRSASAAASPR